MACFLVAATEAVVVTVAAQAKKKSEEKEIERVKLEGSSSASELTDSMKVQIPWSRKLMWLAYLLWGGVVLLAFEHIWHGEVTPWFPFLTAAADPGDAAEMLHEMSTIGVAMIVLVNAVWGCLVAAVSSLVKRSVRTESAAVK